MTEHEVASVVWHRRGNYIDIHYVASESVRLVGDQAIAAKLAEEAGLDLMPTSNGTVEWVRDHNIWWAS